jgi:hypothetical protein
MIVLPRETSEHYQSQVRSDNQRIQRWVMQLLQNQKTPAGWQTAVAIQERAMGIHQLCGLHAIEYLMLWPDICL